MVKVKNTSKATRLRQNGAVDKQNANKGKIRRTKTVPPKAKRVANSSKSKDVMRNLSNLSLQTSINKERAVSEKQQSKWKPLCQPTQTFIKSLIDSCMEKVISETSASSQTDAKQALDELKQRISQRMNILKAPVNKDLNYLRLHVAGKSVHKVSKPLALCAAISRLEASLKKQCGVLAEKVDGLEECIEEEHKLLTKAIEDLNKLEIVQDEGKVRKTLSFEKKGKRYPDHEAVELFKVPD